jgi:hypothetical protein
MDAAEKHMLAARKSMCFFMLLLAQLPYDVQSGGDFLLTCFSYLFAFQRK